MAKAKKVARKAAKPVGRVSPRTPGKKTPRHVSAAREQRLSPAPLMQLATAFWAFGTLAAAVELDLFSKISGAGTNADELMALLGLPPRPAEVLLSGCAGLGLLQKRDGRFHNTPLAKLDVLKARIHVPPEETDLFFEGDNLFISRSKIGRDLFKAASRDTGKTVNAILHTTERYFR
jgi:hypothetical protein